MQIGATDYIRNHWSGSQSLFWSFWINLILLRLAILYLERFTRPPFIVEPPVAIAATFSFFVVCQLIIFAWQIVGVLRTCDRHLAALKSIVWVWATQFGIAASIILTLITVYSGFQSLFLYRQGMLDDDAPERVRAAGYTLTLTDDGHLLHLNGDFEFGITGKVEALLRQHHGVEGIVLSSDGGQVYEGRGVANLIVGSSLDTYVFGTCKSACATAFIGGATRTLGVNGKLGFHQYRLDAGFANPLVDAGAEQEKDRRFYADRDIDPGFLRRVFDSPYDEIWFPDRDELLAAGVVHRIARATPAGGPNTSPLR